VSRRQLRPRPVVEQILGTQHVAALSAVVTPENPSVSTLSTVTSSTNADELALGHGTFVACRAVMGVALNWRSQAGDVGGGGRPRLPRMGLSGCLALVAALLVTLGTVMPAVGCPNCEVGRQAKAEVWDDDFAYHLCAALLPFLVVGCVCTRIEASERG
jgi:hypothetical protein